MKILIIYNTSKYLYKFRLTLLNKLKDLGFDIVVAAPVDSFTPLIIKNNIKFIPIEFSRGFSPFGDMILLFKLYKIYKQENPRLVMHFTIKPNIYGSLICKMTGNTCINTVTGLGYSFLGNNFSSRIAQRLYKLSFYMADMIVFQNNDDMDLFMEGVKTNSRKISLIKGSGVNTREFCTKMFDIVGEAENDTLIFLLIARMLWDKGIKEFIEAAKIVKAGYPKVEFWLIGGLDHENPSAIPKSYIDHWHREKIITYFGEVTDVRDFLHKSSIFVLPSYREGLPHTVLEAMAMGKPIITTNSPGCKETVVNNINGFLVPVKDSQALSDCMIKVLRLTKTELENMGIKSRNKAMQEFSDEIIISKYVTLIKNLLENRKHSYPLNTN
jgi:glycosyltransferase involved in cell wall biosynthesis